ncbi:hypothetical protein BH23CYA1_BH23CYA1_24030 [soil metagenome]
MNDEVIREVRSELNRSKLIVHPSDFIVYKKSL